MEVKSAAEVESVSQFSPQEARLQRRLESCLRRTGSYESVDRFVRKINTLNTKVAYLEMLIYYFAWLKGEKKVELTPDQLVEDNLRCVFASEPLDVKTKRRHTNWLDEYVNVYLKEKLVSSKRATTAAAVNMFYRRNDSELWGDFSVAEGRSLEPDPPLRTEDISAVLKALPLAVRVLLIFVRQSGAEINRILALRWRHVEAAWNGEYPLKLVFHGRKRHKKTYHTYVGRDATRHLGVWREEWKRLYGRVPSLDDLIWPGKLGTGAYYPYIDRRLRETAMQLAAQGLVSNGNPGSWHSYALRHSFETEAAHAGVKKEVRGFFEGHVDDIMWVYNHQDELHEEDLVAEWLKVEPFVSLDLNEVQIKKQVEKDFQSQVEELRRDRDADRKLIEAILKGEVKVEPESE